MASIVDAVAQIVLPKGKGTKGGKGYAPGYNPQTPEMRAPLYRDHLTDIYTNRISSDSRTLINTLVNQDSDVSAAVHSYLTIAGSAAPVIYAYDAKGEIDPKGIELANRIVTAITTTNDYTVGYSHKPTLEALLSDLRYMCLLRGAIGVELVLDKTYVPSELRNIDMASITWHQRQNGIYTPIQKPSGANVEIDLNVPTFFTSYFHQNPTDTYSYSPFVSAINTIAARAEVINELYRIMKVTGFPRLDIEILEEVLITNAPVAFRQNPEKIREFVDNEISKIQAQMANIRSDLPLVHSNAIQAKILNDKNPAAGMQIQQVVDVLDSQNQAALKVMPAVVGKGSNLQTASTETRLFALSTDALNRAVAAAMSKSLTFAARLAGYQGQIELWFNPVELRPVLELEPQLTMRAARLKQDLSLGLITDLEYSLEMYQRPPPAGAPQLSGTGFLNPQANEAEVDVSSVSPNDDSLGRSMAPEGGKSARSNSTKSGTVNRS